MKASFLLLGFLLLVAESAGAGVALRPGSLQPNIPRQIRQLKIPSSKELALRRRHLEEERDKAVRRSDENARQAMNDLDVKFDEAVKGGGLERREADALKRECREEFARQQKSLALDKSKGHPCEDGRK